MSSAATFRAATWLLSAALCTPAMARNADRAENPPRGHHAERNALTSEQGESLVDFAVETANVLRSKPDCSHFVHIVYSDAGLAYAYQDSRVLYAGVDEFRRVKKPQPGDLIVWPGHVGIVVSVHEKTFFSSVRSGILTETWLAPHWRVRGKPRFYRYRVTPDTAPEVLSWLAGKTPVTEARSRRERPSLSADDDDR